MTAHIHMVCGLTGAGKSTYSEQLRQDLTAVRFSIDDWMGRLYFMDRDPTSDFNWFYERVQRSCAQMRVTAEHVLETDVPVIFDCGFTNLQERETFYRWADDLGYPVTLHALDPGTDLCWSRVQKRNLEKGETYAMDVTREMFDFMLGLWQPPQPDEMLTRRGILITD